MAFTSGKYAYGYCDRCGEKVKYRSLIKEWTGFKVCSSCLEQKTKQEFPTRLRVVDPESLRDPRPDVDQPVGNGTVYISDYRTGATPIGSRLGNLPPQPVTENVPSVEVGQVTVVIS